MLGHYQPTPDGQGSSAQNRPGKRPRNAQDDHPKPLYHQLPLSREPLGLAEDDGKRKDTRAPEKDKNRRLSCKECRRLKLKCDRIFPCQSCVKRGCGSLCPEGALTSGRGSRFILANTGQLHEKITLLSDRVRDLEDALQTLQATQSIHPHPLLTPELLRIKTSQDLYISPQAQAPPSSSSHQQQDRASPDHLADSTLALSLSQISSTQPPYAPQPSTSHRPNTSGSNSNGGEITSLSHPPDVPPDILQLSATFPFPWSVDLRIRKRIRDALPPRHEALATCEVARNNALWQYHLDASETFLQNLLHHCYNVPLEDLSPRRLALLLMILSIGSLVDLARPLGSLYGEAYHHLARAAVCEIPLMEEPDFDVLHALFFMIWWHLIFSDNKKAIGYAWNLMGFVAKLAQGMISGTDRDNPRLRGIPEEDEKRRAVFWELLNLDARMSLSLGRPPSICLRHVDAKRPEFKGAGLYVPREEIIYHEWKNAFFIECLTPILEAVSVVDPPPYATIIQLDSFVRDFQVPKLLDGQSAQNGTGTAHPRFLTMQRALVATSRDIGKCFFGVVGRVGIADMDYGQPCFSFIEKAVSRPEAFDLATHPYAPSVLATCLGAASLIEGIETLFDNEPELSARFLYFWFNSYSAAATLALCVARAPSTPFASEAQKHVDHACRLFGRASQILPLCRRLQHVTEKLADKSRQALKQFQNQTTTNISSSSMPEDSAAASSEAPESFRSAHPMLLQSLERQRHRQIQQLGSPEIPHAHVLLQSSQQQSEEAWLPEIYRYPNAGVGKDLRYPSPFPGKGQGPGESHQAVLGLQPQVPLNAQQMVGNLVQMPFVLGAPRVDANAEFNFDHGALKHCEETGYMAWF
ncbi:hypothetical protein H0H92_010352 [Tricholoma furcatifolium]|nr:hypothetical protein H0H92_010352 [Tricholoma furcatifolium]